MNRQVASRIAVSAIPEGQLARQLSEQVGASSGTPGSPIEGYWIVAADGSTITIAQRGGSHLMAYRITKNTVVLMNGQPAPGGRLRAGMKVTLNAGLDPLTAGRIQAHDE